MEKLSGERIGTFVTDAAGRIVIPDLTPQWVVVKETKTRPGYKLDPDPVNVEIKSGKTTVVKFQNQPYPVLDLLKVDAETGKPMLTYCDFPSEHWIRIRTNNIIDILNQEIHRRTYVVSSFPDGNLCWSVPSCIM